MFRRGRRVNDEPFDNPINGPESVLTKASSHRWAFARRFSEMIVPSRNGMV